MDAIGKLMVIKRNGDVVEFDSNRIKNAVTKAIIASGHSLPSSQVDQFAADVVEEVRARFTDFYPNVENIQDVVEKHLVKKGMYEIAKA
ncbi:MAG TPA: ATP cone domain-containing protein, partial [Candidatus Norongarragalinales archaeon]|nr:ATP cone domain-containing protein [Candidatus Norongarragalinales archaeon]